MTNEEFCKYFELFKNQAPRDMVEWGGYQSGKPTPMASSFCLLEQFSKEIQDVNGIILDAGAGASTYYLRGKYKNVISTDPDRRYLNVVKRICGGENYTQLNLILYSDYTFYDYGNDCRIPSMGYAFRKTRNFMYVDDCQDEEVMKEVRILTTNYKLTTPDEYKRFGAILYK
jgi:hypothetical protein